MFFKSSYNFCFVIQDISHHMHYNWLYKFYIINLDKDNKIPMFRSHEFYEISCDTHDKICLGQKKRKIITRYKEHLAQINYDL